MTSVILVDDCSLSCEGLRSYFFHLRGEIDLASIFTSGTEALAYLSTSGFALSETCLFRYDLEGEMTARQFAIEVQRYAFPNPLVCYRTPNDGRTAATLLASGVSGYVLKGAPLEQIREAIYAVRRGEIWVSPAVAVQLVFQTQRQTIEALALTERERSVLELLADGLRNLEIADHLYVAKQTVNNTLSSLYKKLNLSHRTQLMLKAREWALVLKPLK